MQAEFEIFVSRESTAGKRYRFSNAQQVSIGRGADCTIRLKDPSNKISRLHVIIAKDGSGELRVVDQKTPNGTWLGGKRLAPGAPGSAWPPGQILKIGEYELTLSVKGKTPEAAQPAQEQTPQNSMPESMPKPLPRYLMIVQRLMQGEPRIYLLSGASYSIGRAAGNDIVVPSDTIDQQHLAVTISDTACKVKVLNSINGTSLDGRPLRQGGEFEWRPGSVVSTLDWSFEIAAWQELANPDVIVTVMNGESLPEGKLFPFMPGTAVDVMVRLQIAPAGGGKTGIGRFHYLACTVGQPPTWQTAPADTKREGRILEAGSEQQLSVRVGVPANERSEQYPLLLAVLRADGPAWRAVTFRPLTVKVEGVPSLTAALVPPATQVLRLGKSQLVTLTNSGNVPLAVTVTAADSTHNLDCEILDAGAPPHLKLPVGSKGSLRVRPGLQGRSGFLRHFRLFGRVETLKFQMEATTDQNYKLPLPDVTVKSAPFIPPPLQPWIVPLIVGLCVLLGFLLWPMLQPQVTIAVRSACDAPGAPGETNGSSYALCVREAGLGSTTILGPNDKGLTPVAAPQRRDGDAWLQSNTLYEVLAAPGDKLTVQRALLGFEATPAVTLVPLEPNSIANVALIPGPGVLCGIGEKIALTVDLERQLSEGDQLAVNSDAQQEPFSTAGGETHYEKRLEDNLLQDALAACEKEDNFAEVSAALQAKLTSQSFAPVVSAPVTITLRPALCKLVPGATLSTGPRPDYAVEPVTDSQMDVRIIANPANGTWVPVRTQSSTVPSWVQESSLDCSADPAVTAALAAKRFPVPTLPGEPTPIPPTPVPTPTPTPEPTAAPPTPTQPAPLLAGSPGYYAGFRRQLDDPNACVLEGTGFLDIGGIWLRDKAISATCGDGNGITGLGTETTSPGAEIGRLASAPRLSCDTASKYLLEVAPKAGSKDSKHKCYPLVVIP